MASALAFLHERNVIYFDLKSDNVLVWKYPLPHSKEDDSVWLKLTDYGISRVSGAAFEIRTSSINGTPGYIAPEVLLGRNDLQADKVQFMNYIRYNILENQPSCHKKQSPFYCHSYFSCTTPVHK